LISKGDDADANGNGNFGLAKPEFVARRPIAILNQIDPKATPFSPEQI
jgi:hypothetical protein